MIKIEVWNLTSMLLKPFLLCEKYLKYLQSMEKFRYLNKSIQTWHLFMETIKGSLWCLLLKLYYKL